MKYKLYLLLLVVFTTNNITADNIIRRDADYPSGSRWVSPNGKFELVYSYGYLVENEITTYGKIKLWQFPNNGEAVATAPLSFWTIYEDYNSWFGTGTYAVDSYTIVIGGQRWDFKGTASLIYPAYYSPYQAYDGRAGYVVLKDDGNISITTEASNGAYIWTSTTSPAQNIGKPNYAYIATTNNLTYVRPLTDELKTAYFATGKISFLGACKVTQKLNAVKFVAKGSLEMLPGFETAITGNGAFVAKPLTATLTTSKNEQTVSSDQQATDKAEIVADSKFAIYPNPTTGLINISLNPGDAIKTTIIFDITGKQVAQFNGVTTFTIDKMPVGIYLYNIETEKQVYTGKLLKQ